MLSSKILLSDKTVITIILNISTEIIKHSGETTGMSLVFAKFDILLSGLLFLRTVCWVD
jgi:hypothetical protein